jgi:hypothetical protein
MINNYWTFGENITEGVILWLNTNVWYAVMYMMRRKEISVRMCLLARLGNKFLMTGFVLFVASIRISSKK